MKLDCYCQPHIDQKSNWNSVALCILKCLNSQPHLKARTADYRGGLLTSVRFYLLHLQRW